MDDFERLKALALEVGKESAKCAAAQCRVEAREKDLEAAIHLGEWGEVEKARYACVSAYEHVLDARVGAVRHIKRLSEEGR